MTDAVRTTRRGAVLEVVLDRPKANAIDAPTSRAMGRVFAQFRDDPELRVAILTGAGEKFFSAGWDLKTAGDGDNDFGVGGFGGLIGLFDLEKPVIAAVNGYCAAGGLELAVACDILLAADHAVFFLSEATLGLTTDPSSIARLLRTMPRQLVLEMLYTGRRLDAHEAVEAGLALRMAPMHKLMDEARALADRIAASAPLSVRFMKQVANRAGHLAPADAWALRAKGELPMYRIVNESEDAKEGPAAFAEKRAPRWKGR